MTAAAMIIFALVCATLRFLDGMDREDSGLPTWARNLATIGLSLAGALWARGHGDMITLWMAAWAAISIIVGETKWESPTWQALRFLAPAGMAVLPLDGWQGAAYPILCAIAGLSYPALFSIHARWPLPRLWRLARPGDDGQPRFAFDGPEAYARLPLGAAVIGALPLAG